MRWEEIIQHAKRDHSSGEFEVLTATIPYPDVYLLIYRHTDTTSDFGMNKSMQTTRFTLWSPETRAGGIVKTEWIEKTNG